VERIRIKYQIDDPEEIEKEVGEFNFRGRENK